MPRIDDFLKALAIAREVLPTRDPEEMCRNAGAEFLPREMGGKITLPFFLQQVGNSSTYDLHELYSFSEMATWNSHSNTSNYNTTPFLTLSTQTFTSGQWYSFSFLNLAREWFSGTKTNNGILFKSKSSTATGSMAVFASSNYVNSWQRPVIYYEYKTKGS